MIETFAQGHENVVQTLLSKGSNVKLKCPILDKQFSPEEVSAQVLRKLSEDAGKYLGENISPESNSDQAGTIFSQNLPIDLRPLGQQLDLEAFYEGSAPRWGKGRISGLLRRHPGHRANLPAEGRIGIHYQQTF